MTPSGTQWLLRVSERRADGHHEEHGNHVANEHRFLLNGASGASRASRASRASDLPYAPYSPHSPHSPEFYRAPRLRDSRIFTNDRLRSSSSVNPVSAASVMVIAPELKPRTKKFSSPARRRIVEHVAHQGRLRGFLDEVAQARGRSRSGRKEKRVDGRITSRQLGWMEISLDRSR